MPQILHRLHSFQLNGCFPCLPSQYFHVGPDSVSQNGTKRRIWSQKQLIRLSPLELTAQGNSYILCCLSQARNMHNGGICLKQSQCSACQIGLGSQPACPSPATPHHQPFSWAIVWSPPPRCHRRDQNSRLGFCTRIPYSSQAYLLVKRAGGWDGVGFASATDGCIILHWKRQLSI